MNTISNESTACAPAQDNIIDTVLFTPGQSAPGETTPNRHLRSTPKPRNQRKKELEAKAEASASAFPVRYLDYKRKQPWRLFKRSNDPDAQWFIHFEDKQRGIRTNQALGISDAAADDNAKIKIDAFMTDRLDTLKASLMRRRDAKSPLAYSTIAELCRCYLKLPQRANATTRDQCQRRLQMIIRKGLAFDAWRALSDQPDTPKARAVKLDALLNDVGDVGAMTCDRVLTDKILRNFFDWIKVESELLPAAKAASALTSANSYWTQARAMFTPFHLARYAENGVTLPDLARFLTSGKAEKFKGLTDEYIPAPDALLLKTIRAWMACPDRDIFLAVGLEFACGLRHSEALQVTWGMIQQTREGPLLDGRGVVKNRSGLFIVTPLDPFWRWFNKRIDREGWRGAPGDRIVHSTYGEKKWCLLTSRVSAWFRALGWTTEKTNHEIRKFDGSLLMLQQGPYAAQRWLRHRNVKTTERFYARYVGERLNYKGLVRVNWAR